MAELLVRDLDEELVARLQRRAANHGRSAEAEHREILREVLAEEPQSPFDEKRWGEQRQAFKERAAQFRATIKNRTQTPSEILQREGRDER